MADLKTQIEVGIDGSAAVSGANQIKKSIVDLGDAAAAAGRKGGDSFELLAGSAQEAATKANAATRRLISDAQRSFALLQAGGAPGPRNTGAFLETRAAQIGADRDTIRQYAQALDDVAFAQKRAAYESAGFNKTFDYTARTAKQTTAALRQVPSQLTDIFVSLQGGQAPLTVLLQQGGQLKDIFGGIGPAARALAGYLTSLINPFTLAAGAAAALALAYNQGSKEADAYAKALILSGNAAGATVGQLTSMAEAIDGVVGTQAEAAEAVAQFSASGKIAAGNIEDFSRAAIKLERTTGQAISKTVEQFASLRDAPTKAAIKLNETPNFLTLSIYKQIKALEDQGRATEAAALAQRTYASEVESRSDQIVGRLGYIERAWLAIKDATKEAGDALLNVGRPETLQAQLARTEKLIEAAQKGQSFQITASGALGFGTQQVDVEAENARAEILRENIKFENQAAEAQGRARREVKERIAAEDVLKRNAIDKVDLLKKELALIETLRAKGTITNKEAADAIAGAKERFKLPAGARDPQRGIDRSDLQFDLSQIKSEQDRLIAIYSDAEKIIEALRSGGLMNERDYYEAKRQFIELESAAKEDAFRKEIARLQEEGGVIAARKARDQSERAQQQRDQIDNARAVAKAQADLSLLRARTSAQETELTLKQTLANRQLEQSYASATRAAQEFLDTQNTQQAGVLAGLGQGQQDRNRLAGINQIEDRFLQQRQELENQRILRGADMTEAEYQKRLAIINEFQQKSLASFNAYYDRLIELQSSAAIGANEAINNYIENAQNVAATTDQFDSSTLDGREDSLTKCLTTGKSGFTEFANAIVADITRIIVKQQIANALASQMGNFNSSSGFGSFLSALLGSGASKSMSSGAFGIGISGAAMGGEVSRGQIIEVNETNGPGELFNVGDRQYLLASQAGSIRPQKASSSTNREAMNVIMNFTLSAPADRRTQSQVAVAAGRGLQSAMARYT